jgi:hypothetical protein
VILAARAVILCISELSVFIVGVALEASLVTLGVIRLFVSVALALFFVASDVLSTLFNDNIVLIVLVL